MMHGTGEMVGTEGVMLVLWLLFMLGGAIGYIVLLVALWRGMRAHESMAQSVRELVEHLRAAGRA